MTLAMVKLRANDAAGAEQVLLKSSAASPRSPQNAFVLGRFYQLVLKTGEAEKQFRHALELDPKHGPSLAALGSLLYAGGKLGEAEQMLQRASALPDKQYRPLHAIFLLQTGKNDAAIRELDEQYKANVEDRTSRTRLVTAYMRLGRTSDALSVLTQALKRNSKDTDALIQRGDLNVVLGKYQEAQTDLTEVLRFQPDSPEAHLLMARVYRGRGASQSQIQELTEALRLNPKMLAARVELAYAYTVGNSPKLAIALLAQAPAEDQRNITLIIERNAALYALGDYAKVRKGIDEGLAISRHPALLLQDGMLRLKNGDYKGSRVPLEEALKQNPLNWSAVNALAVSYVGEKKLAEATAIVREYTSRPPESAAGQQFLATWLSGSGDLTGAAAAFEKAKLLDPNSVNPDFGLAQIDLTQGKPDSARSRFIGILNKEPHNLRALLSLGRMEVSARPVEAIRYFDRALQEDLNNIEALNSLAYLLADTGQDPDRALALAQQVKGLAPEDPAVNDTIGWAYYNKSRFRESIDYLGKAATGGTPLRKCHLAMAYIKLGDRQRAATILLAVLKDDPSLPEAQKAIQLMAQAR
jgi:tetratricopeptide (TPR) repeat protein